MSDEWETVRPHKPLAIDPVLHRRRRFKERARTEFIKGAELQHRRLTGRPMTADELQQVLRGYPGDP